MIVNYVNEQQINSGVTRSAAYDRTMLLLAGLLAIGFLCNSLVRPIVAVGSPPADPVGNAAGRAAIVSESARPAAARAAETEPQAGGLLLLAAFWLFVAVPLAWGLWATIRQAAVLFG